jgi:hypothetical protein
VVAVTAILATPSQSRGGVVYDATADFSIASNPNGAWSYGVTTSLGSPLSLYTLTSTDQYGNPSFESWYSAEDGHGNPAVVKNTSSSIQQGAGANLYGGELALHPGPLGEYSVVRWVAPSAGSIDLSALFQGRDNGIGTTTDVHILYDNVQLFSAEATGFGSPSIEGFSGSIDVRAGDTIDFAVGYGSNHNYLNDTTGLDAQVVFTASVPEPSTFLLAIVGLACLTVCGASTRPIAQDRAFFMPSTTDERDG